MTREVIYSRYPLNASPLSPEPKSRRPLHRRSCAASWGAGNDPRATGARPLPSRCSGQALIQEGNPASLPLLDGQKVSDGSYLLSAGPAPLAGPPTLLRIVIGRFEGDDEGFFARTARVESAAGSESGPCIAGWLHLAFLARCFGSFILTA